MIPEIMPIDHRHRARKNLERLMKDPSICERNKELIRSFLRDCYADGLSHARVAKYAAQLKQIARMLAKPFPDVVLEDMKAFLEKVELSNRTAWSKGDYRIAVRKFWRWLDGSGSDPPLVNWIKTTVADRKKKVPSDLLTEDEIELLLKCARHPRDRAMIAVLWETGCRAGELLTLRVKSFKAGGELCFLDVHGKTGFRRVPIVACVPDLTKWLTFHPGRDDPNSPLWVPSDTNSRHPYLTYSSFTNQLRRLVSRAGIKKRVHPHLFRHSRATFLANKLTEAQMKHFFGWTQGSEMASVYVHLSGRDIQDSILQLYGKTPSKSAQQPKITVAKCARCGFENPHDSRFCGRCGSPASSGEAIGISQKLQAYDRLLTALLSDRSVVKALDRRLGQDSGLADSLKEIVKSLETQ